MNDFESNIKNIYGKKGEEWLLNLPKIVVDIGIRYNISGSLMPVSNLSYNYVFSGLKDNIPVIFKLSLDHELLSREAYALKCFSGLGGVDLIAQEEGLLLLNKVIPGTSLKAYFPNRDKEAIEIICNVIKKLHQAAIPENHNFPHIKNWLSTLDKDWNIPDEYLQKARKLGDYLLATNDSDILLHGDLHHDNILNNGNEWIIIDPLGVIGDPSYEVIPFIYNPIPEILSEVNAAFIIQSRISIFAKKLNVSQSRIANWCFVRAVLGWIWTLQDKCDTEDWRRITIILDELSIT